MAVSIERSFELSRQLTGTAVLLVLLIPVAAQTTPEFAQHDAEDGKLSYGAESDFNSAYVWRGIVLNNKPVAQPSAWIGARGVTLTGWSSLALTNSAGYAGAQVIGLTLTYGRTWKKLRIEPAIEAYQNRQSQEIDGLNTMEGSLKLTYSAGRLRIFTTQSFDILTYKGAYFGEAGLGYQSQITKKTELAVFLRSGWASSKFNDVYIGVEKRAFNFIGGDASLTVYLNSRLYLRPHFEFSSIADRRLRSELSSPAVANIGLAIGFEF